MKELFSWGEVQNLRRLLIAISIQLGQQFSGSNMIHYYAPVIFQGSMGRNTSLIIGGCLQITYLLAAAFQSSGWIAMADGHFSWRVQRDLASVSS
jgi:hypothetical protein